MERALSIADPAHDRAFDFNGTRLARKEGSVTFEITTTDKPGNFATAKLTGVPEDLKPLFPKPLRATCTAGEEYAAKALVTKVLNLLKRSYPHTLVCQNPDANWPEAHKWNLTFQKK